MREFVNKGAVINSSLVFVQEICKLVLALVVIQLECGMSQAVKGWTLAGSFQNAALRKYACAQYSPCEKVRMLVAQCYPCGKFIFSLTARVM